MSTSSTTPASDYMREAELQDQVLAGQVGCPPRQQEAGDITSREAAEARIQAMEHHLGATRNLRIEYFGAQS